MGRNVTWSLALIGYNLWIISHLDSQRGATVERLVDGKDALAAVLERGEFEGILISLCPGVNKKQLIVVVTADLAKAFGKLNLCSLLMTELL